MKKEKPLNRYNCKKYIALGLSLGALASVNFYAPQVLAEESNPQAVSSPESNQAGDNTGQDDQALAKAKEIAGDWVDSVEYVNRDEAGNPVSYTYTRNYQTHQKKLENLKEDEKDKAVEYIISKKDEAEKAQYYSSLGQLSDVSEGLPQGWAENIAGQDEENIQVTQDGQTITVPKSSLTEDQLAAVNNVLAYKDKLALRDAYNQAPDFVQREYLDGKIIRDGELKYRGLHAYEDKPEFNHYHYRPVSRYNEVEQAGADYVLGRNLKQLAAKYQDELKVAPDWAPKAIDIIKDDEDKVTGYVINHGDHDHEISAETLSEEEVKALDFIVGVNRDNYIQNIYRTTPEWTRHVDFKYQDRDGKTIYKTYDLDGQAGYETDQGLSEIQKKDIDFILADEEARRERTYERSLERAQDYLPGLIGAVKDSEGNYVKFVYEDGKELLAYDVNNDDSIPRRQSLALGRVLDYREKKEALELDKAKAIAPRWAEDLAAKVTDDQGKVTYVEAHGDHYHYFPADKLSEKEIEALDYIVKHDDDVKELTSLDQLADLSKKADDHPHIQPGGSSPTQSTGDGGRSQAGGTDNQTQAQASGGDQSGQAGSQAAAATDTQAKDSEDASDRQVTELVDPTTGIRVRFNKSANPRVQSLKVNRLNSSSESLDVYDIELVDAQGNNLDLTGQAEVLIPIASHRQVDQLNGVYYLGESLSDGARQSLTYRVEDGKVIFNTDHFSIFALSYASQSSGNSNPSGTKTSLGSSTASSSSNSNKASKTDAKQVGSSNRSITNSKSNLPQTGSASLILSALGMSLIGIGGASLRKKED